MCEREVCVSVHRGWLCVYQIGVSLIVQVTARILEIVCVVETVVTCVCV